MAERYPTALNPCPIAAKTFLKIKVAHGAKEADCAAVRKIASSFRSGKSSGELPFGDDSKPGGREQSGAAGLICRTSQDE